MEDQPERSGVIMPDDSAVLAVGKRDSAEQVVGAGELVQPSLCSASGRGDEEEKGDERA